MRDNNINVTIHAGEAYGPESIAQAIHVCGAHRIGHGCRLREQAICSTTSTTTASRSSVARRQTSKQAPFGTSSSHPLKLYKNLGLRVTVNTDNRLMTDTTVSRELWLCHTQMGLTFAGHQADHPERLQERFPTVPRQAAILAQGERGARTRRRTRDGTNPGPTSRLAGGKPRRGLKAR